MLSMLRISTLGSRAQATYSVPYISRDTFPFSGLVQARLLDTSLEFDVAYISLI